MAQKIITAAICWEPEKNDVMFLRKDDNFWELPKLEQSIGDQEVKTLKLELQNHFDLRLKYLRTLPDAWANLLFLHSNQKDIFTVCYIFMVMERPQKLFNASFLDNYLQWLPINSIIEEVESENITKFSENDANNLELFLEIYDLN